MTREDAVSKAADWWVDMIFSGVWDNGDAATEGMHAFCKSLRPGPKPEEAPLVRKVFLELLSIQDGMLYCDYGNSQIDSMFRKHNLNYDSNLHCPQKAGTNLSQTGEDWRVEVKTGYGQPWVAL